MMTTQRSAVLTVEFNGLPPRRSVTVLVAWKFYARSAESGARAANSHPPDPRQVPMLPVQLQPVADERAAVFGFERGVVGREVDRAQIGTVEQRDELQIGRLLLPQLR